MNMRNWNDKLFMDAMPGRKKPGRPQGDFSQWLREMKEYAIGTVVCLAPDEQIAAESPEYADWLARHGEADIEVIHLPIDDFSIPVPFQVPVFWNRTETVAAKIMAGERVFVHCGAGFGRTGMFAVAVLMKMGYSYDEALAEIKAVGSYPETPEQWEFLVEENSED
jgi:protein-tyrosine phosphatase